MYIPEQDGEDISEPSTLDDILLQSNDSEIACEVQVYMPTVRDAMKIRAIK